MSADEFRELPSATTTTRAGGRLLQRPQLDDVARGRHGRADAAGPAGGAVLGADVPRRRRRGRVTHGAGEAAGFAAQIGLEEWSVAGGWAEVP